MKQNIHHLYYLYYTRRSELLRRSRWIIITLLLFSTITIAQESPQSEFVLAGGPSYEKLFVDTVYNSFVQCGFNTMVGQATSESKSRLDPFNLQVINMQDTLQLIYYYSSSYYSKWEAEEDQPDKNKVGVKHSAGKTAYWNDGSTPVLCWSTKDIVGPTDTIVYGPTYHQEKWYRRWLYRSPSELFDLQYTPRFRMALARDPSVDTTQNVCRLYVLVKYRRKVNNNYIDDSDSTYVLTDTIYLKVSDFPSNGQFKDFYLSEIPSQRTYEYPEMFRSDLTTDKMVALPDSIYREDRDGGQGVQFCIDWLRSDTLCTLFIDNIEVYDNDGWNYYLSEPYITTQNIRTYAQNYSDWTNIKYWLGGHEPSSIDSYLPIKTVDSILQSDSVNAPPLINVVWPSWTLKLNGESQLERYYNTVLPNKLLLEDHPISASYNVVRPFDLEVLRRMLQESYTLTQDSKFYYHVQSYGEKRGGEWSVWRQPTVPEYRATMMLALTHGVDGLVQAQYNSEPGGGDYPEMVGLIDTNYNPTALWYELKDNIFPRLKGTLGKKLLILNYTGDTLYLGRYLLEDPGNGFTNSSSTMTNRYLTLTEYEAENPHPPIHFHAGFFAKPGDALDNYFMLDNLITTFERNVLVTIDPPVSGFQNYRFRNIEGLFDTTFKFNDGIEKLLTYPPGEGYLYQVSPVIKYGGRFLHNETISSTTTLLDDMRIEDDAVLTVNSTYNVNRTITITGEGSITTTSGGTMKFYNDESLIIEGVVTISGTSENPLVLDFINPADSNGIIIKPGGSLTISNCQIKNAATGIISELNADTLIVEYVDFIDCEDNSISIAGRNGGDYEPPIKIDYCSLENSDYGISVNNTSSILIRGNEITDTDCGIKLSNVSDALIINNYIESNNEELQGILALSSGGIFYGNIINGHTSGIQLGNSSPIIGMNTITNNKYHGIYVGSGSIPYMRGEIIDNPPIEYLLSGYNIIEENGGYYERNGPADNDGSEIYFYNSNAVLDSGCNIIADDRQVSPPLVNTLLLMSGISSGFPITVNAQNNFWGDTVYSSRFSGITVNYIPYRTDPCSIPIGGEDELVMMNQFGMVIDTIYSTGMEVPELSETELIYAEAEESFLTGDLTSALQKYESIISSSVTDEEKYKAYERKYTIGKLQNKPVEFFNSLSSTFANLAGNTQDSLAIKRLTQLSTLSKVGEQEYANAISDFDGIVQSNPNTEEAVYAEIDALTTALLIEGNDSTLQKGTLGKYLIKSSTDYLQKVDEILRKHFGGASKENANELLPTEYTLYQNYPNPFNPVTTLKYDLPEAGYVSLIIYDILGRKVKELVNTKQQAGRYEIQFNATNLASGVYIYQLIAANPSTSSGRGFMSSKKMILIK